MGLTAGTRLGAFEVAELLGAGGMGEVYRARDTRLNRDVAIKVLPEEFARQPERLARFRREAQLLASLNHPNIAAIYGLEEQDGLRYLVLEYVPGQTLAEMVGAGFKPARLPLAVDEALDIARQIAEALEAAHEKGIIHRDLKPANVKVTPEGKVKVLDFGLAKALEAEGSATDLSKSPTISAVASRAGVILGTAAYMSPEQARGKPVDKRTDIWAFGCVLYEMLAGKAAFAADTITDTMAAILKNEPNWSALPAETPAPVRTLLRRCLQKDPRERLRDAGDALLELGDLDAVPPVRANASPGRLPSPARRWVWALAGALAASLILALALWMKPAVEISSAEKASIRQITSYTGTERDPAISPDGRYFAFVSNRGGQPDIWVRQVSGGEPVQLTRDAAAEANLIYAPDGEFIYYNTAEGIFMAAALGGTPHKVVPGGREPSLSADGSRLAFLREEGIYVAARDGTSEKKIHDARGWQAHASLSPDGRRVAFTEGGLFEAIYLQVVGTDGGKPRRLADLGFGATTAPAWLPDGQMLLFERSTDPHPIRRASDLWIIPAEGGPASRLTLNPSGRFGSLRISGNGKRLVATLRHFQYEFWQAPLGPDPEANGKAAHRLLDNSDGPMWIQRSGTTLLFSSWLTGFRNLWAIPLDGSGSARQVTSLEGNNSVTHAALSPDGTRVAFTSLQTGNAEIWTMNTDGSNPVQLTRRTSSDYWPAWTNDGKWIAFGSEGPGPPQIWKMPSTGGDPVQLTSNGGIRGDWSPLENRIVYSAGGHVGFPFAKPRLEVADFDGKVLLSVDWPNAGNTLPVWSPDGRRFTAIRNENPSNDSVWVFDAITGQGKAAVKFPGRFHMIFRACWTPEGRAIIVNRVESESHIVLLEDFWR